MSVFYPTTATDGPRLPWLNRPSGSTADGYARFGGIAGVKRYLLRPFVLLLGAMTRVPATLNAPIARTQPRPLVLFSQCVCLTLAGLCSQALRAARAAKSCAETAS